MTLLLRTRERHRVVPQGSNLTPYMVGSPKIAVHIPLWHGSGCEKMGRLCAQEDQGVLSLGEGRIGDTQTTPLQFLCTIPLARVHLWVGVLG